MIYLWAIVSSVPRPLTCTRLCSLWWCFYLLPFWIDISELPAYHSPISRILCYSVRHEKSRRGEERSLEVDSNGRISDGAWRVFVAHFHITEQWNQLQITIYFKLWPFFPPFQKQTVLTASTIWCFCLCISKTLHSQRLPSYTISPYII